MIPLRIPLRSRGDFGRRDFSSRRESRREAKFPAAKISPGPCFETRQDSRREAKIPAAKISPGSCRESRQDSRREGKIPAAKISARSCHEAHQDFRREAIIPPAKISPESYCESRQDFWREAISRWQNLGAILPGISPRVAMPPPEAKFLVRFIAGISPRISFGSSPMFTCLRLVKIQIKAS